MLNSNPTETKGGHVAFLKEQRQYYLTNTKGDFDEDAVKDVVPHFVVFGRGRKWIYMLVICR